MRAGPGNRCGALAGHRERHPPGALDWALGHAPDIAVRLVVALGPWWYIRGQLAGVLSLLQAAAAQAEAPGDLWCAVQYLVGQARSSQRRLHPGPGFGHRDHRAPPTGTPWPLLADALASRAAALANMNQILARVSTTPTGPSPWPASWVTRPERHWP